MSVAFYVTSWLPCTLTWNMFNFFWIVALIRPKSTTYCWWGRGSGTCNVSERVRISDTALCWMKEPHGPLHLSRSFLYQQSGAPKHIHVLHRKTLAPFRELLNRCHLKTVLQEPPTPSKTPVVPGLAKGLAPIFMLLLGKERAVCNIIKQKRKKNMLFGCFS